MTLTIRRAKNEDRVLHYGTVACTLLKDIGNASNQPYLQAIASVSLLIMETVKRVKDNKEACVRMTERAYELVCAIINICRDSEAELAPAMVRSITQFSETLEKILSFVRSQVKGGFWRRVFRSMEDADLVTECNAGLKHALDVFGVQSGIIAAMTMAEMQKDATRRHEELITILKEKRARPTRSSTANPDGSRSRRQRPSGLDTDLSRSLTLVPMLPASPKIFYGRDAEVAHIVRLLTGPDAPAARVTVCGPDGAGKSAVALAATHHPDVAARFGAQRYFVDCAGAADARALVGAIAAHLGLTGRGRTAVLRHLGAAATAATPVLLVLDALDRAWRPYETRGAVEDVLSLLADLQHVTIIATLRGGARPRQVRWTRPFLPPLAPLPADAARAAFLDISDVPPDDPALPALLDLAQGSAAALTRLAGLASFEGCAALVARWEAEGAALLLDPGARVLDGPLVEEPGEMCAGEGDGEARVHGPVAERDVLALLAPRRTPEPRPSIESVLSLSARGSTALDDPLAAQSAGKAGADADEDGLSRRSSLSESLLSDRSVSSWSFRSVPSSSSGSSAPSRSSSSDSLRPDGTAESAAP